MDADTVYRVLTVYDADTSKGKEAVGGFAVVLDHMMNLAAEAKDVVGEMVGKIIEVGAAAEEAKISIAGLLSATGLTFGNNFNVALEMSSEILTKMRHDAAALPGTFEDLTAIFQRAIPGGSNAGKSVNDIEGLSAQMMAVGKTFGMSSEFIGREFAEMMEGRASSRVALFSKMKQFMGDDMNAQKFNALGAPEKWEAIERALTKFNPMIREYATTWEAISTTAESYLTNIIRVGSAGVFDMLKTDLADLNAWYERNETTILEVSRVLFNDLGAAIDFIVQMIKGSVETVLEWMQAFGLAKDNAEAVNLLVDAVGIAVGVITAIVGITTAWTMAQWALNIAMAANPVGLIVVAVGGLAALLATTVAYWYEMEDIMARMADNKLMRSALRMSGQAMGVFSKDTTDADIHRALVQFSIDDAAHDQHLRQTFGNDGFMAHMKDMMGFSNTAVAGPNWNNPTNMLSMMTGMDTSKAGMPDAKGLLDRAGKPVTTHTTNIGALNLYTNIYDAEDPARVLQHLTDKIRGNLEHPSQSPSVAVHR